MFHVPDSFNTFFRLHSYASKLSLAQPICSRTLNNSGPKHQYVFRCDAAAVAVTMLATLCLKVNQYKTFFF